MDRAKEAENAAQQEIYQKLAAEERAHSTILQGIIDFISAPDMWLENAERHHMDTY